MKTILWNEAWRLLAQLKYFPVNPRPSETEAGFQFNQVKCQLLFIIGSSFNRFPAWALGSQGDVQDRGISPLLSSCLPETAVFALYIVSPMHLAGLSNPFRDLQLGPLEIIRTKYHEVYKQEDALEKYSLVWVCLTYFFKYFPSVFWPERCWAVWVWDMATCVEWTRASQKWPHEPDNLQRRKTLHFPRIFHKLGKRVSEFAEAGLRLSTYLNPLSGSVSSLQFSLMIWAMNSFSDSFSWISLAFHIFVLNAFSQLYIYIYI